MNEITLRCFLNSFYESSNNGERFCFILGAGASKESGIKTGIEMAKVWYEELIVKYPESELNELIKQLEIEDSSVISKNYFDIYDLRFYPNYNNGYAYIEKIMENAQPSYGYYPLVMQLVNTENNLVITTNFDCMVEDSLFIYTDKRPIVVNHESLADYININSKRPIVAKIHRGLFFEPFNRRRELRSLPDKWIKVLRTAFRVFIPIVIGYAGGDHSLMEFLKDESVEMKGLYWCYYKNDPVSDEIKELVERKKGYLVPIDGFDSMMFSLSDIFKFDNPRERIMEVASNRVEMYEDKYDEFSKKINSIENPDESQSELIDLLKNTTDRLIDSALQRLKKNLKDVDAYKELANAYKSKKDYIKAMENVSKAIELKPDDASIFELRGEIYEEIEDYENAIADFTKAIELKEDYIRPLERRGITYIEIDKYPLAIIDLNKVIELKPDYEWGYEWRGTAYKYMKEYNKAIEDYNKVIELKPDFEWAYRDRGDIYKSFGDYESSLADYNKVIELEPNKWVYNDRGEIYIEIKEYNKAIEDFSKAIGLDSDFELAYRNRAKAYEALGEKAKEREDLEKADNIANIIDKK